MKLKNFFEKIEEIKKIDEKSYEKIINFLEGVIFAQERRIQNEEQNSSK